MAQQKPAPPTSEPLQSSTFQPSNWQSEDFVRALASLERLQNQLDQVRRIPANLISPFREQSSRQEVFASFNSARQESFKQIADLRLSWEEPRAAQLFQQCNSTREKHVDLVEQYDIGIWGWVEREQESASGVGGSSNNGKVDMAVNGEGDGALANGVNGNLVVQHHEQVRNTEEDEKTACALFGPEFEQFGWNEGNDARASMVVKRPGPWLRFEVQRRQTVDGVAYEARCLDETKEAESISRCLYRTVAPKDIFGTLETLLAYGDATLSRADCESCGRYRDGSGMVPCTRLRKPRPKTRPALADDPAGWVALHESCL